MKRLLTAFLALCLILGILPVTALALEDSEPNDSIPTAQEFEICDTINGSISEKKGVDWYKFTLEESGKITLKMTSYMKYYTLSIYDWDGKQLWADDNNEWDSSAGMRTDSYSKHLTEGTYYIRVTAEYDFDYTGSSYYSTGEYVIKTDYVNANATEVENNDNIAQSNELPLHSSINGQIAVNDSQDFYRIELPASGKLILDLTSYMKYAAITLYDADGRNIWSDDNNEWDTTSKTQHLTYSQHLLAGTYYIKITSQYDFDYTGSSYFSTGNYTLAVDYVNANANEVEPNNSIASAQWIIPNKQIIGQIALNDSKDFFEFTLAKDMTLTVDFTSYMKYYALQIYNDAGDRVWYDDNNEWDSTSKTRHNLHKIALKAGTYTMSVTCQYDFDYSGSSYFSTGNYTFKLNTENPFSDVPADSFYYDPVLWAVEQGITSGTTGTTFSPNDACMRAHVVTFLWRAAGSPAPKSAVNPFTDVKTSDFFYKPVLWAVENGITTGTSATTFSPTGVCNRAQVVTFLHRAFESPAAATDGLPFTDVPAGAWYEAPIAWAVENGITNGLTATEFGPNAACNRAQVVTFLYRAYNS
ncbi:MAG: hypothetical protein E7451_00150 [Ruminococcaceae bacterium]|nr:hypothetical protein [Oscillospiraceae bacterium]